MFEYKYNPKIKSYHIILLSIVICPFFAIKSNSVYKIGDEEDQLNDDYKFLEKLYLRKLDFKSDVDEICSKSSENLKLYYITGNTKSIGINNDNKIESEDNPQYINALINIISGKNDSVEDDINEYVKHLIPVIVLFSIAILSILIWIIFIICRCFNCCCCCCCKKKMCKLPFFFIIMILYTLVLSLSFFELSQSNSIFVGLADTECSILKFIDEVLEGETKKAKPKWSGINEITGLFQDTITQIQNLTPDNKNILSTEKDNASSAKDSFETALQYYSTNFLPSNNPDYKQVLNGQNYYLDIIYNFGNFTKGNSETISSAEPPNSFVSKWYQEFKLISENSEKQMGIALENYGQLEESKDSAESTLNQGISSISDIEESFNDIKEQISGIIISYSGKIDQNGKIAFKVILSVYMILDLAIIIYIILLMFFSFKYCRKCCCCFRCIFLLLLHIFWNILAVLTIFILFFGCIFILFGTVGKDLISVVSFLVSDKNLNQEEPIFFGQVKNYLSKCINGNGDISSDIFGDLDSMDNIDKLRNAANEINNITEDMEYLKANPRAYKDYKEDYENRINYTIDNFELINLGEGSNLNFRTYLNNLNSDIASSKNHEWNISCSSSHSCDSPENSNTEHLCINPNTCENKDITDWYSDTGNNNINVINAFIKSIKMSKSSSISNTTVDTTEMKETNNIEVILEDLKIKYNSFIQTQIDSLTKFSDNINQLAEIFNRFDGERNRNNIYSIINCKFIGKNVKVILKNFEELLGNIIYTVGICLEISGISMLISIALTILLNSIIINSSIGK